MTEASLVGGALQEPLPRALLPLRDLLPLREAMRYSSATPDGYVTVIYYLAAYRPDIVEVVGDDPDEYHTDVDECRSATIASGLAIVVVEAPAVWQEEPWKITTIEAYPFHIVHQTIG